MSLDAAGERLGCGRSKVFELLREGRLRRAKSFGKRTLVTTASVEALEASMLPVERVRGSVVRMATRRRVEDEAAALDAGLKRLLGA